MASQIAAISEGNAQQFRLDMYSLKAHKSGHRSFIHVHLNETASLGPWPESIPEQYIEHYKQEVRHPILASRESAATFVNWQKHHKAVRMGSWPTPSDDEVAWYQSRKETDLQRWEAVGIAEALELCFSLRNGGGNRAPIAAAVCFWDTSSNTFNFKFGQMGITLLDILTITGLPIHPSAYKYGDFNDLLATLQFKPSDVRQPHCKSYSAWTNHFSTQANEEGGIAFLELWFCKYIFCIKTGKVTGTWTALAAALFNGHRAGLGQPVLASLYRLLYNLSLRPFDYTNLSGPLWILDLCLHIYFPQFRHPDVNDFPKDQVLGMAFAGRDKFDSPAYVECFKYFFHLDESALDSAALILNRTFPSPLEQGFLLTRTHTEGGTDVFKRAVSCYDFNLSDEYHSYELYSPNHFARQLGLTQEIPFPLIDSLNRYSSWRMKASTDTTGDESDRFTIRFKFALPQLPPPVSRICRSTEAAPTYVVWWKIVSAMDWDRDAEDVFRSIFEKGNAVLGFAEDQRVLNKDPNLSLAGKQSLQKKKKTKKAPAQRKAKRTNPSGESSSPQPAKKRARVIEENSEEEEEMQTFIRRRRTQTTTAQPSNNPQNKTTGEEDEEMTAKEQAELNQDLAAFGMSPLAIPAIPISVVYADEAQSASMKEPIQILSDSEEGIPANPEQVTVANTSNVPSDVIEPSIAVTAHSGEENQQPIIEANPEPNELGGQPQPMLTPNVEMADESRKNNLSKETSRTKDSDVPEINQAPIEEINNLALNTTPTPEEQALPMEEKETPTDTAIVTDNTEAATSALNLLATVSEAHPQAGPNEESSSSVGEPLPLEERLRQLLESDDEQESIKAARDFLGDLGSAKFDDPSMVAKIREQAAFLQAHVTGEELQTANALLAKLDALPLLEQAAQQVTTGTKKQTAYRDALEMKNKACKDQLQKRRTFITDCDKKLAELENFKAEIEKKIRACHANKAQQTEYLAREVPAGEKLKHSLAEARKAVKKTTLEPEEKIVAYQRALVDIASLGRRI